MIALPPFFSASITPPPSPNPSLLDPSLPPPLVRVQSSLSLSRFLSLFLILAHCLSLSAFWSPVPMNHGNRREQDHLSTAFASEGPAVLFSLPMEKKILPRGFFGAKNVGFEANVAGSCVLIKQSNTHTVSVLRWYGCVLLLAVLWHVKG